MVTEVIRQRGPDIQLAGQELLRGPRPILAYCSGVAVALSLHRGGPKECPRMVEAWLRTHEVWSRRT